MFNKKFIFFVIDFFDEDNGNFIVVIFVLVVYLFVVWILFGVWCVCFNVELRISLVRLELGFL